MTVPLIARPAPDEYDPYYQPYLDRVPDGNVIQLLQSQVGETLGLLGGLSEEQAGFRYAPGKWSIREVLGHLADVERVLTYRAFRFSRADATPLPGFEEDDYIARSNYHDRALPDVAGEFESARVASLAFYRALEPEMLTRRGEANQAEMSVRAVPWVLAGHERHHVAVLRERYLPRL
jgi:hypothetical protein